MFLKNRTIGVLVVSLIFALMIAINKPNSLESVYKAEFDRFWTYKIHSKKQFEMMVIGDSRVYRGISPQTINKEIPGISIENFGFSSGKLDEVMFSEVEKKINMSSKNKTVIIGITPVSLTDEENLQMKELLKLTKSEVFDKIYVNYVVTKFLTPLKPSQIFSRSILKESVFVKETFYDNGWVSTISNQTDHSKYLESYKKLWETRKVSQKRLKDLYSRVNEWSKEGIRVFAFRVPSSFEMDTLENKMSGFNEEDCITNIVRNGCQWINLKKDYTRYLSYDGSHLDDISAILLSADIATEIRRMNTEKR